MADIFVSYATDDRDRVIVGSKSKRRHLIRKRE